MILFYMYSTELSAFFQENIKDTMIRIILLKNVCGQHDPYYIIVERMRTT
jgi:hypothetical protein